MKNNQLSAHPFQPPMVLACGKAFAHPLLFKTEMVTPPLAFFLYPGRTGSASLT